jgi:hypothetical protein
VGDVVVVTDDRRDDDGRWRRFSGHFTYGWHGAFAFTYGGSDAPEPQYGHQGALVGAFGERVVCQTCGVVCLPDRDEQMWLDSDMLLGKGESVPHMYPFTQPDIQGVAFAAAWITRDLRALRRLANSATLEALGVAEDEDAAPTASPASAVRLADPAKAPVPPEYRPTAMAAAREEAKAEQEVRRRQHRRAIHPDLANAQDGKSAWGRTQEYRRIEKRRERARKRGVPEDVLDSHPTYRLPRRDDALLERMYETLVRTGRKAGLLGDDRG